MIDLPPQDQQAYYEQVWQWVHQVPHGRVATYGQIAKLAGIPRNSRQVGYVLRNLDNDSIPWFRVVNSKGEISSRNTSDSEMIQQEALLGENVEFDQQGRISLARFGWQPKSKRRTD